MEANGGVFYIVFFLQEIDGKALLLLTSEMIMKYMGLKLGPSLKICNVIDKLKSQLSFDPKLLRKTVL